MSNLQIYFWMQVDGSSCVTLESVGVLWTQRPKPEVLVVLLIWL
ncbi:unnamed protein product [Staurois parvus]|uniref:Uncharacterized protein n=1 Tax=Staurois parvus TaxID=386267 RepID=A0ABN9AGV8_9NEOB|nr:unnamed protein product [Staurois parvus]